jgi:iron complex transport system substrate-binding protein
MRKLLRAFLAPVLLLGLALGAGAARAAERIVTIGSDVTEIAFALGKGADIVAVDDTSTWPAAAAKLPKLGYLRQLTPEPILARRPTLILASAGAGPEVVLRQVERAGVRTVRVPDEASAAGVAAKVRAIGAALGKSAEAEALADAIIAGLPRTKEANGPRMMLVLANAPGRVLAAGQETAGDSFIRLAGGRNSFTASGYKPLSPEAALAASPEVLLVPSHVLGLTGGLEALKKDPVFAGTPAVQAGRVVVVDSLAALNFGPRLPEAVARLRRDVGLKR